MPRIIIARPSGANRLEVEQATFDEGFYPGFVYVADASGSPSSEPAILDGAVASLVPSASASATSTALRAAFGRVFTPEAYGGKGDGSTDDTAAVNAAIAAAQAAGGGTVLIDGAKTYRCLGAITPVYTGPSNGPVQKPVRITSTGGAAWSGYWSAAPVNGGGILDLRYDGTDTLHPAKIDTRGAGFLEIDHVTLVSGGSDDFPFLQTTNTTCHIHHNAFVGNPAKSGTSCAQDAIIFGGTTNTIGSAPDAPFQGYGSSVHDNFFSAIRRCFYGRKYCNATWVYKNTVSTKCGSSLTGGAAFVLEGSGTDYCTGNVIAENLVEFSSYKYAVRLAYANSNSVTHNNFFDNGAGTLGGVLCDVVTDGNMVIEGFCPIVPDFTEDATVTGHNTHITSHSGISSTFSQPTAFTNIGAGTVISRLTVAGGPSNFTVQPATATGNESANLFQIKRASAEATFPSLALLTFLQNGSLTVSGPNGGNLLLKDNTATTQLELDANTRKIYAPGVGNPITIDTGSGGSALIVKANGLRNTNYSSSVNTTWYTGAGTPEGVVTATVGCLYTRTDGGAGTTLYVKESGAGNTGWIAK